MPKLSIVIPAYNEENQIPFCLDSIVNQSYSDLEVIVVDNCSTDKTAEIVDSYSNKLNLKIINESKKGISYTKNTGAKHSQGKNLFFLDADSQISTNLLYDVDKNSKHHKAAMVKVIGDANTLKDKLFFGFVEFGKRYFNRGAGQGFYDNEFFQELGGFNTNYKLAEDTDLWVRARESLKKENQKIGYITSSHIITSSRRMQEDGYLKTLAQWGLAYLGFARNHYKDMSEINENK